MHSTRIQYTEGMDLPWEKNQFPGNPNIQDYNRSVAVPVYPDDPDRQGFIRVGRPERPTERDSQF